MESQGTILIIEDDRAVATVLAANLEQAGFRTVASETAEHGLVRLAEEEIDVVLTDERLPGMRGLELLKEVNSRWPEVPTVMLTAFGTIQLAVEAMKAGAHDFLCKPYERDELIFTVRKAAAVARHRASRPAANDRTKRLDRSSGMDDVHRIIEKAAAGRATVLIRGESGTGKGLAARAIHERSARREAPFVAVHCGALPDNLLESELFGYEKGAFTGASSGKPGRVELAEGG